MSKAIVSKLNSLVADFTVFYQKLRHYHWNVKGSRFFILHQKFEEIYDEINLVIDELAERIVGLEGVPLHTLAHVLEETSLQEDPKIPDGEAMVAALVSDMTALTKSLQSALEEAEDAEDRTTVNMLDEVKDGLEAHIWMLKAWEGK